MFSNLEYLIEKCDVKSCGQTSRYVFSCIWQKWSRSFIEEEKYKDHDPNDFRGGKSYQEALIGIEDPTNCKLRHGFNGADKNIDDGPYDISHYIQWLKNRTILNGFVSMTIAAHVWVVIVESGNFYVIDSYVHGGEPENRKYDRKLEKRPFDFVELELLIRRPTVELWNRMFNNHSINYTSSSDDTFENLEVSSVN